MRRTKPEKREIPPDVRYNSVDLQKFIHHILRRGKKSLAVSIVYDAMDIVKEKTGRNPLEVFELALKNVGPIMEVRPRRVGGAYLSSSYGTFPVERRLALAIAGLQMLPARVRVNPLRKKLPLN